MYPRLSRVMIVCLVGASLVALTCSMSSLHREVSDYRPQGGDPPTGGSIHSSWVSFWQIV